MGVKGGKIIIDEGVKSTLDSTLMGRELGQKPWQERGQSEGIRPEELLSDRCKDTH